MHKLKTYIVGFTTFLIPIFFLTITHEFYDINKFMLISISVIILLSISTMQLIQKRKFSWSRNVVLMLIPIGVFLLSTYISALLSSDNKIQPLLDITNGPLMLTSMAIYFWYVAEENEFSIVDTLLRLSGICISSITIVLMMRPFDTVALPRVFQFLKMNTFTPIGTQTDLLIYLGFIFVYQSVCLIKEKKITGRLSILTSIGILLSLVALSISLSSTISVLNSKKIPNTAPLNLSLRTVSKALGTPMGFFFGAGINSFGSAFTQVKDGTYNSTPYWSQSSFNNASSATLKIIAESGIIGTFALLGLFIFGFILKNKTTSPSFLVYSAIIIAVAPASFMLFFILFLSLALSINDSANGHKKITHRLRGALLAILTVFTVTALCCVWYVFWVLLVPTYRAEIAMRNSVYAIARNNLQELYDQQRHAIVLNPYIERYRVNFSQTNIFIAKQVASKPNPNKIVVTQTVQRAINEAQTAVSLNSSRASNWENLGVVYKNVLGVKGAEQWAIGAFQRAILLDPQNVSYRLELGGIFYSLKQYEDAIEVFQQAILLKPDLPNSYYNLAYAYYQSNDVKKAVEIMDSLLVLLKKQSSSNFEKVLKERQDFASGTPQKQAPSVLQ